MELLVAPILFNTGENMRRRKLSEDGGDSWGAGGAGGGTRSSEGRPREVKGPVGPWEPGSLGGWGGLGRPKELPGGVEQENELWRKRGPKVWGGGGSGET